jgi:acetylornithine deacetylase
VSALDVVSLLEALVRCPSPSGDEQAVAALLVERLRAAGLAPETDGRNVWVGVGDARRGPTLLLLSHLDTVPVGDGWTRPPLTAHREGERIYGRGSNDAKGCVAAMAGALLALDPARLPGRVLLAAVAEEETGRPGGCADLLPRLGRIDAAVVGEPTGLVPVAAQKGRMVLEVTLSGRQAHAARPEEGDNAAVRAARAVVALDGLRFERRHPELGPPTAQVTVLRAGERTNVIPGAASVTVDVRTTPDYTTAELVSKIAGACGHEARVRPISDGAAARATPTTDPLMRLAAEVTGRVPVGSPTVSDWANLPAQLPAVKLGPGESPRSHTPDEYVTTAELQRGVEVYRALAERWLASRSQ